MNYTFEDLKPGNIFLCNKSQYFTSPVVDDEYTGVEADQEYFIILKYENTRKVYLCYGMRVGYFIASLFWLEDSFSRLKKIG